MRLWAHRFTLVFIGVPVVMALMVLDAACAAWDEFSTDWRDFVGMCKTEWTSEE